MGNTTLTTKDFCWVHFVEDGYEDLGTMIGKVVRKDEMTTDVEFDNCIVQGIPNKFVTSM